MASDAEYSSEFSVLDPEAVVSTRTRPVTPTAPSTKRLPRRLSLGDSVDSSASAPPKNVLVFQSRPSQRTIASIDTPLSASTARTAAPNEPSGEPKAM